MTDVRRLSVDRGVIVDVVRLAALEVSGVLRVGRAGPIWRRLIGGRSVQVRVGHGRVDVRLRIVARPGQALTALTSEVRSAVAAAIVRLLDLELGGVTVVVDAIGG